MNYTKTQNAPGHWILAKMGKKVLRPGGKELTEKLISGLNISSADDIVEFAPGLGFTCGLALEKTPKSYTGVDADQDAIGLLKEKFPKNNVNFMLGNAQKTEISDATKDKVYGEAMLTMHSNHQKAEIIKEANRILKKGGLYAIHEMGLVDLDETLKNTIQKELAATIKVNARPLTKDEWTSLLEEQGFVVKEVFINDMLLLEPKRLIDDEGLFRALKIVWNIMKDSVARKRISDMRDVFRRYQAHLNSIAIIAQKV